MPIPPSPFRIPHSGLTLVEVLIAMALFVTAATASMVMFRGISRAWRTGHLRTERYQQARLLFDLFSRELSTCVANARFPLVGQGIDEAERLRPNGTFDELFFVGTLPGRSGLVERGYWVNADGELRCHDDEPADSDYATGLDELCGTEVAGFEARYFNGEQWADRWDGRPGAPQAGLVPKAVLIILKLGAPQAEQFETVIHVPTS